MKAGYTPLPLLLAALLFLGVYLTHGSSRVTTSNSDSRWTLFVAHSLIHDGDIALTEFESELQKAKDYCIYRKDGIPYNLFPVVPALFAVPFVAGYELFPSIATRLLPGTESARAYAGVRGTYPSPLQIRAPLERAIASFIVAATAVGIYFMAAAIAGPWLALIVAATFSWGTSAWSTASRSLWQHGPSMLIVTLILAILVRGASSRGTHAFLGTLLAAAYIARPTNGPFVALMLLFQFMRNRATFALVMTPCAVVLGSFMLWSYTTYDSLLPPYYQPSRLEISSTALEAFFGNLLSPARGLFIFSPVLIFSGWGMFLLFRYGADRLFDTLLCLAIFLHIVSISLYPHWWGGFSYGPRLTSDLLPALCFYLIPAVENLTAQLRMKRYLLPGVYALLLVLSVWIHYRGANDSAVIRWDRVPVSVDLAPERVWDWSDPPFLR